MTVRVLLASTVVFMAVLAVAVSVATDRSFAQNVVGIGFAGALWFLFFALIGWNRPRRR